MSSNIDRVARRRIEQMVHDARLLKQEASGATRFFERERFRHGRRELQDRGDPVD